MSPWWLVRDNDQFYAATHYFITFVYSESTFKYQIIDFTLLSRRRARKNSVREDWIFRVDSEVITLQLNRKWTRMAIKVFEFILRAVHAINFCVSLATSTGINPGYKMYKEFELTSQPIMSSNEKACSTQSPDQVFKRVRSSIECSLICKGTKGCSGVNWKKPSTCQLYFPMQSSFGTEASCTYFELGKKFKCCWTGTCINLFIYFILFIYLFYFLFFIYLYIYIKRIEFIWSRSSWTSAHK